MKIFVCAAVMLALAAPAAPVVAQSRGNDRADSRSELGEYGRDRYRETNAQRARRDRQAYRDAQRSRRAAARDWRRYRQYDWNRSEPGQSRYYADRYYRSGSYYQTRRLGANDRIYRGQNDRYYCRRPDGTTGLIIGGLAGGLLGNTIGRGDSKTLATLIGAAGGALAGRAIERNNVRCD